MQTYFLHASWSSVHSKRRTYKTYRYKKYSGFYFKFIEKYLPMSWLPRNKIASNCTEDAQKALGITVSHKVPKQRPILTVFISVRSRRKKYWVIIDVYDIYVFLHFFVLHASLFKRDIKVQQTQFYSQIHTICRLLLRGSVVPTDYENLLMCSCFIFLTFLIGQSIG